MRVERLPRACLLASVVLVAGVAGVAGCQADDTSAVGLCTETMVAGQAAECVCDGDVPGVQACQDDGTLSKCICAPDGARGGGDGDGETPADGGTRPGDGDGDGAGDGDGDGDGALHPDAGLTQGDGDRGDGAGDGDGDGSVLRGSAPTDGEQLSFCYDQQDCNDGLGCYSFGRYCSGLCFDQAACDRLGEGYSCFGAFPDGPGIPGAPPEPLPGICRIQCRDLADASCPSGMVCVPSGGGFPGSQPGFRCVYTEEAAPVGTQDTPVFGECHIDGDCTPGLGCTGGLGLRGVPGFGGGYCVQPCLQGADCTEQPASGTATPQCLALGGFPGEEVSRSCSLDCGADLEGCPDGMECIVLGFGDGVTYAVCDYR